MPEHGLNSVINADTISELMTKTLGNTIQPITSLDTEPDYFSFYKIKNVLKTSDKLTQLLELPEMATLTDLQSCIALIGLNIWNDIWMYVAYRYSHIPDNHEYQNEMIRLRIKVYQFEKVLIKNEGVKLPSNISQQWKRPSSDLQFYLDNRMAGAAHGQNQSIVVGMTMNQWLLTATHEQIDDDYQTQISNVWNDIDVLSHNYDETNLNAREINNNKRIKSMVNRIQPLIKRINAVHQKTIIDDNQDMDCIEAIDMNTLR